MLFLFLWAHTRQKLPIIFLYSKWNISFFKNSFLLSASIEWSILDQQICNSEKLNIFNRRLLKLTRPSASNLFNCYNPKSVNLLTRLRLGLSLLHRHKFKRSYQEFPNAICSCGNDIAISIYSLFRFSIWMKDQLSWISWETEIGTC